MMRRLLSRVIQTNFEQEFWAHPSRAMLLDFNIRTKPDEQGDRHMQMLLFAPSRYVQIWIRETWDLWQTKQPTMAGETQWALAVDHDSCWRDTVGEVLCDYEDRISTWGGPLYSWYQSISTPEKLNKGNRYQRPQ